MFLSYFRLTVATKQRLRGCDVMEGGTVFTFYPAQIVSLALCYLLDNYKPI